MGGKSEKGDSKEWPLENTKTFIAIIYDRVKQNLLQGSNFKGSVWEDINKELTVATGQNYGIERLKGKYSRMRTMYREFSSLIGRTGVTWDAESDKVNAPEDVWKDLKNTSKNYKQFKNKGFIFNYIIVGEIFNGSTATGKLSHASTKEPPTSDEEAQLEKEFLSNGVHIDSNVVDVNGDNTQEENKRKSPIGSRERRRREAKNARTDKLDSIMDKWNESLTARKEASKAKAEKYKSQLSDPYSVKACMELLNSMDDVSSTMYNNAVTKFIQAEWRCIFIKMPLNRRIDWLGALK